MSILTRIEMAFGADLSANPATWTWTNVSLYALGAVAITAGRADAASQTAPTRCTFRLRNTDGRFTPRLPTSPLYPNVRRQTPVRISLNPGTGYVQRFQGYVDEIVLSWPGGNSEYAEIVVAASGSLRRLGQGTSPPRSVLNRFVTKNIPKVLIGPVAAGYWPIEDSGISVSAASGLPSGPPLTGTAPGFSAVDGPKGSARLPEFAGGAVDLSAPLPVHGPTSAWTLQFWALAKPSPTPDIADVFYPVQFNTDSTSVPNWYIDFQYAAPQISVVALGTALGLIPSIQAFDGNWHHYRILATASGGTNITLTLVIDGVTAATQTVGGFPAGVGAITDVSVKPGQLVNGGGSLAMGHLSIHDANDGYLSTYSAGLTAYDGEDAAARITRLCAEEGVPITVTGTSTTTMGAQRADTFLNLVRDSEIADIGILYDGGGPGLSYLTRSARCQMPVSMALDCVRQQVKLPFSPTEDDQRSRNDWTVSRANGSSARSTDPAHIATNGLYDDSVTLNIASDNDLINQAAWRVHQGTAEEMRVPGLSLQLIDRPELWAAWLATTLGERATAANLPAQYPPGLLDMIVEGYTETWDSSSWRVDLNTSPYRPWEVFQVQDARLGRLGTDGSQLHSTITSSATSFTVDITAGQLWTVTAADFPLDIEIEGEQITLGSPGVAGISGGSSPQTFATATRSVNGVRKAHNANAVVKLWKPGVLAL